MVLMRKSAGAFVVVPTAPLWFPNRRVDGFPGVTVADSFLYNDSLRKHTAVKFERIMSYVPVL